MSYHLIVLGAGESGTGAALLAKAKGLSVFVSDSGPIGAAFKLELDKADIPYEEGEHTEELILAATEVIKSPGIPDKAPVVKHIKAKGIPVISELEFGARYTKAKFIAITGSNGKTTTTLLTYHLLKHAGLNVGLAGNIGFSLARQVIADSYEWYVLEVSSFQLDGMYKFRADVAILMNITPDHLDRYEYKFENYIASKFRVIQNQNHDNYFITFADSEVINAELKKKTPLAQVLPISVELAQTPGAFLNTDALQFNFPDIEPFTISLAALPIPGKHNYLNCMAACLAATAVGLKPEQLTNGLPTFQNAAHRLEPVGTINGVRFINDSKATNIDSVKYALDSFAEPLIWIAGGVDKGNDYTIIEAAVMKQVKVLVCLGKDNAVLINAFKGKVPQIIDCHSISEAIDASLSVAKAGYVVLLSPACASFDLFKNYEDRGNQFRDVVSSRMMGQ